MRSASVDRRRADKTDLVALHRRLGAVVQSLVEFVNYTEAAVLGRSLPPGRQEQLLGDLETEAGRWQSTLLYALGVNEALLRKHRALPAPASTASFQTLSSLIAETQSRVTEALLGRTDVRVNGQVWEAFTWLNQRVFETLQTAGTLERENATLRSRLSQLEQQLANPALEQQLQEARASMVLLQADLDRLRANKPALNSSLAEELEVTFLKRDLDRVRKQRDALQEHRQEQEVRHSYPGFSDTQQHLQRQQEELTRFLTLIKALETDKTDAEAQAQQHLEARLKAERDSKLGKAAESEQLLSQLRVVLEEKLVLSKALSHIRLDLTTLLGQPLACEAVLVKASALLHTGSLRITALQQRILSFSKRDKYTSLRKERDSAVQEVNRKEKDMTRLKQALLKLKDELEGSRKQATERQEGLQRSIALQSKEREALKAELSTLSQERDALESQNSVVCQERDKLKTRLSTLQSDFDRLGQELQATGSSAQNLNSLELRLNQLSASQQEKDSRLAQQVVEIRKFKSDLAHCQSRIRFLETEVLKWTGTSAANEAKARQVEGEREALEGKVRQLEADLQQSQTSLAASEAQGRKLAANLQSSLSAHSKAQQLESELQQLKSSHQAATAQLEADLQKAREGQAACQTKAESNLRKSLSDLSSSEAKGRKLENELRSCSDQLAASEAKGRRLGSEFAVSQTRVNTLESDLRACREAVAASESKLRTVEAELQVRVGSQATSLALEADLKARLATAEATIRTMQTKLKEGKSERETSKIRLQQLEDEKEDLEKQTQSLNAELQQVRKDLSSSEARVKSLLSDKDRIRDLETEVAGKVRELASSEARTARLETELKHAQDLSTQNSEMQAETQTLHQEIATVKEQLQEAFAHLHAEREKSKTLTEDSNSLRKEVQAKEQALGHFRSQQARLETLTSECTSLQSELRHKEQMIAQLSAERAGEVSRREAVVAEADLLREQLAHQSRTVSSLNEQSGEVEGLRKQLGELSHSLSAYKTKVIEEQQERRDVENAKAALTTQLRTETTARASLEVELTRLKQEAADLYRTQTEADTRLLQLQTEAERWEAGQRQAEAECTRLQSELLTTKQLDQESTVLRKQVSDLKAERATALEQVSVLTSQKEELAGSLQRQSEELNTLTREHLGLQKEKQRVASEAQAQIVELRSEVTRLQTQLQASDREALKEEREILQTRTSVQDSSERLAALQREVETLEEEQEELIAKLRSLALRQKQGNTEELNSELLDWISQQAAQALESAFHPVLAKLAELTHKSLRMQSHCALVLHTTRNSQSSNYKRLLQQADQHLQRALEDKPKGVNPFQLTDLIEELGAETEAAMRVMTDRLEDQQERLESLTHRLQSGRPAALHQVSDFVLAVLGQLQLGAESHLQAAESRLEGLESSVLRLNLRRAQPFLPVREEITVLAEGTGQPELASLVDTVARLYSENEEQTHVIEALTQENALLKEASKRGAVQNSEQVAEMALNLLEVLPEQ